MCFKESQQIFCSLNEINATAARNVTREQLCKVPEAHYTPLNSQWVQNNFENT